MISRATSSEASSAHCSLVKPPCKLVLAAVIVLPRGGRQTASLPTPANRRHVRSVHLEAWLRNETFRPDHPLSHGIDCPEGRYLGGFLRLFDRYTEKS